MIKKMKKTIISISIIILFVIIGGILLYNLSNIGKQEYINNKSLVESNNKEDESKDEKWKNHNYITIPDSILNRSLEQGNSLIIGKIVSIDENIIESVNLTTRYSYQVNVLDIIIPGYLNPQDIKGKIIPAFAGASYGDALIPEYIYIMFIDRSFKNEYNWLFRDSVIDVSDKNKLFIDNFSIKANKIYEKTTFYRLLNEEIDPNVTLPELPDLLIESCLNFKTNPTQRDQYAKEIYESNLGSRDITPMVSSVRQWATPNISLTKSQVIQLLGEPSIKRVWGYDYFCGEVYLPEKYPNKPNRYCVLSMSFDEDSKTTRLNYYLDASSKFKDQ